MVDPKEINIWNAYINCQTQCGRNAAKENLFSHHPFITLSRQTGAGGITISENLITFLKKHDVDAVCPWTIFDKNLVHTVIEKHHLPTMLEEWMPEDKLSELQGFFEDLFDLKPSEWTLVHKTSETILHLAQLGCCILVGRGANIITRKLPYGVHIRLVGSVSHRVHHVEEYYRLSHEDAMRLVEKEDRGRKEYIRKHFDQNIDDPMLYHMMINTDLYSYQEVAQLIGEQVISTRRKIREGVFT